MAITQTVLTTGDAELFAAAAETAVTLILICNTTGTAETFTLHVKPTTGTGAAVGNMIYNAVNVPANDTYVIDTERLILPNLYTISGLSSANTTLTVTISTLEIC